MTGCDEHNLDAGFVQDYLSRRNFTSKSATDGGLVMPIPVQTENNIPSPLRARAELFVLRIDAICRGLHEFRTLREILIASGKCGEMHRLAPKMNRILAVRLNRIGCPGFLDVLHLSSCTNDWFASMKRSHHVAAVCQVDVKTLHGILNMLCVSGAFHRLCEECRAEHR